MGGGSQGPPLAQLCSRTGGRALGQPRAFRTCRRDPRLQEVDCILHSRSVTGEPCTIFRPEATPGLPETPRAGLAGFLQKEAGTGQGASPAMEDPSRNLSVSWAPQSLTLPETFGEDRQLRTAFTGPLFGYFLIFFFYQLNSPWLPRSEGATGQDGVCLCLSLSRRDPPQVTEM